MIGQSRMMQALAVFCVVLVSAQSQSQAQAQAPAVSAGDWRAAVRQHAREHFRNPAWGYSHSERDYALARELAATDHVALDDDVLFAAAFLHDIAAFPPWGGDEPPDHSDLGADAVPALLTAAGFPVAKLGAVQAAIRTHMYYRKPAGPEAVYLHDADALDWLGAIGIARILGLVDPNGGDPDGPKAIGMIEANLHDVPPTVVSRAARALVGPRLREAEQYLQALRRETDSLHTL